MTCNGMVEPYELISVVPNGEDDIDEGIRGEVCRKVSVSFDVVFT